MTNSCLAVENWFSDPLFACGYPDFLALNNLRDTSEGYLVDDSLVVECKIDVISVVKDFSSN